MKFHRVLAIAAVTCLVAATSAYAANRIWSPHKVTQQFVAKQFKIEDVRRKGSTYVVLATGPKGNKVRLVVDGKTGKVRGMDVVKWASGARRVRRGSHGTAFFSEFYEFGVTIPEAQYVTWVDYDAPAWISSVEYVEVTTDEYTEEVTFEEVTYEETVTEETVTETEELGDDDSDDQNAGASDDDDSGDMDDGDSGAADDGDSDD
jgi:hypothetical protein